MAIKASRYESSTTRRKANLFNDGQVKRGTNSTTEELRSKQAFCLALFQYLSCVLMGLVEGGGGECHMATLIYKYNNIFLCIAELLLIIFKWTLEKNESTFLGTLLLSKSEHMCDINDNI